MLFLAVAFLAVANAAPAAKDVKELSNPIDVLLGANGLQTTISLGTPGQDFNVLLDTNVAGLWVPGDKCNEDVDGASCDTKNVFTSTNSFTFTGSNKLATVPFLGEDITLNVSFDKFRFGPHYESALTENNLKFGTVTKLPLAYEDISADGVLGLGTISENGFDSPFSQLVKRGNLPNPVISIFIPPSPTVFASPAISIGTEDFENCDPLKSTSTALLVPKRNWAFHVKAQIPIISGLLYEGTATLDFTSDYIHVPETLYETFLKSSYITEDPITKELLIVGNARITFTLTIGQQNVVNIDSNHLVHNTGGEYMTLKIKKSEKPYEKEFKLGLPFLRYRCTVLDYNGRLGFSYHA